MHINENFLFFTLNYTFTLKTILANDILMRAVKKDTSVIKFE